MDKCRDPGRLELHVLLQENLGSVLDKLLEQGQVLAGIIINTSIHGVGTQSFTCALMEYGTASGPVHPPA